MRLNRKKLKEMMDSQELTPEAISQKTGLCYGSVRWILENGFASEEAMDRIAEAVGVEVKEVSLPESSGNIENSIEFLKDGGRATVSFSQGRYKTRIRELAKERPQECHIIAEDTDGSLCAHIPVTWIRINPPRNLTEEQREKFGFLLDALKYGTTNSRRENG